MTPILSWKKNPGRRAASFEEKNTQIKGLALSFCLSGNWNQSISTEIHVKMLYIELMTPWGLKSLFPIFCHSLSVAESNLVFGNNI